MDAETPVADAAPRESAGCVLGIGLGLITLVASLGGIVALALSDSSVDGPERVRDWFPDGAPFALELLEAQRTPLGDTLVLRLGRTDETPRPAPDDPEEIVLLEYPSSSDVDALFAGDDDDGGAGVAWQMKDWSSDPSFDLLVVRDGGDVTWDGWKARYLVVRSLRDGGGWRESARVDVSRPGRHRALLAQWPVGTLAREETLRTLLSSLALE